MSVVDEFMSREHWWDDTGEAEVLRKTCPGATLLTRNLHEPAGPCHDPGY